jgi:hypothetical protein
MMWQNLLADRFGLTLHHEPKEFRVEELNAIPTPNNACCICQGRRTGNS